MARSNTQGKRKGSKRGTQGRNRSKSICVASKGKTRGKRKGSKRQTRVKKRRSKIQTYKGGIEETGKKNKMSFQKFNPIHKIRKKYTEKGKLESKIKKQNELLDSINAKDLFKEAQKEVDTNFVQRRYELEKNRQKNQYELLNLKFDHKRAYNEGGEEKDKIINKYKNMIKKKQADMGIEEEEELIPIKAEKMYIKYLKYSNIIDADEYEKLLNKEIQKEEEIRERKMKKIDDLPAPEFNFKKKEEEEDVEIL